MIASGLRSIEECLRLHPKRIIRIKLPANAKSERLQALQELAKKNRIPVEVLNKVSSQDEEAVEAELEEYKYRDFDEIVSSARTQIEEGYQPVVVVLDGITDPQNLGAIIRTAAFMGIFAIVLPKDRSAQITGTVFKVASGGLEHVPIVQATNITRALAELKEQGFWIVGFAEKGKTSLHELKRDFAPVLVIGNEEKGIRPLVQENCDYLVKIAGPGQLQSLNASVAAALAMNWSRF